MNGRRAAAWLTAAAVGTMPYWLPQRVTALRGKIFTLVNGEEGTPVLSRPNGAADFLRIYADPAADGRSHGAGLSDLFWYWLAPGPQVHQEHLEPGPRYEQAARVTRTVLASRTKAQWTELATRCTARALDEAAPRNTPQRLRDLMMPIWADIYYELVFGEPCPPNARELIVANADDVVSALKCLRLRHMRRRARLTRYLRDRIDAGTVPIALPALMTPAEQAFYLQGTFFNTAVVQMSEAMAHLLLAIAQHQPVQDRLREAPHDDGYLDHIIDETLRVWPLFGIAHRITTSDIDVRPPVAAGSVVLFDYPGFHHGAGGHIDEFAPDRWEHQSARTMNFIPFGVSANRPCPARGVAPIGMVAAVREVLGRFVLTSSVAHTRSLPNRAPVFLTPVGGPGPAASRLVLMKFRDRWADVGRSVVQLLLGTFMVWDARRLGLCRTYFADHPEHLPAGRARRRPDAQCPVTTSAERHPL